MKIRIEQFGGVSPKTDARLLKDFQAQKAENTKLWSRAAGPWRGNEFHCIPAKGGNPNSLILYPRDGLGNYFLHWQEDVDLVRGILAGDDTDRAYYTGGPEGKPQVFDNTMVAPGNEQVWEAGRYYSAGDVVIPTLQGGNGNRYVAQNAGIVDTVEPLWLGAGFPIVDNEVTWIGEDLSPLTATPCGAYPDRSYHLGVPAPAVKPTVARNNPSGTLDGIREAAEDTSYDSQFDVIHDGVNPVTVSCKMAARIIVRTPHNATHSIEFRLYREVPGASPIQLDTQTANVNADANSLEPNILTEGGGGIPKRTVSVTETLVTPGVHRYYVSYVETNIVPSTQDQDARRYTYSWASDSSEPTKIILDVGEDNPFTEGDRISIQGETGIIELNSVFDVIGVEGPEVTIYLDGIDPADFVGDGTWEQLPDEKTVIDRRYVYTYVAVMGGKYQEGPPSPPSDIVEVQLGASGLDPVTVSLMAAPPTGYNISRIRIYRTVDGEDETTFKFVDEIPVQATYSDTVVEGDAQIGEELSSTFYDTPPEDLYALVDMPGGILAGISKNDICFSEPYQPHAWPVSYRRAVKDPVGLGVVGNTLYVLTKSFPYAITGTHPDSMTIDKLEISAPCVSKRSIVDMGYAIVFSSPSGLFRMGPGNIGPVTEEIFDRDQWEALDPTTIHAERWADRYVGFYDDGSEEAGFIFDPRDPMATFTFLSFRASAAAIDDEEDILYLIYNGEVVAFDRDYSTRRTFSWRSKRFVLRRPTNFGALQVHAKAYPVQVNLYSNTPKGGMKLRSQNIVSNDKPVRLRAGFSSVEWEVEVISEEVVEAVYVAETPPELRDV